MDIDQNMLLDEAKEMARDALGDQADDDVLLQEVTEQIMEQLRAGWGVHAADGDNGWDGGGA